MRGGRWCLFDTNYTVFIVPNGFSGEVRDTFATNRSGGARKFDLSPDGENVAYQFPYWVIYVTDRQGEVITEVSGAIHPSWSRDGLLAFAADWTGIYNIYSMDVERSMIVQLTHETQGFGNVFPAWSPDGRHILYSHHYDATSPYGYLYAMNADGSDQHSLTDPVTRVFWACILTSRPESLVAAL
jgi:Tol biopolymer transport system component